MDALSQLVKLLGLEAKLDLRCQFAEGFSVDHAPVKGREIEFHLVLSGSCVVEIDGHIPLRLQAGDFLALPGRLGHCVHSVGPVQQAHPLEKIAPDGGGLALRRSVEGTPEIDLLCGRFTHDSNAIETLFMALPHVLHVSLSDSMQRDDLARIVSIIRAEVDAELAGVSIVVGSFCTVLFTLALRASSQREGIAASMMRLVGDARLARATQAIFSEPERDWTLEQLAALVAMSRATFARRFFEVAATTPAALLLEVRMSRAASLLRHTRRSVADIGMEVGYQSEAAFAKAFRRVHSLSPSAFRRTAAGESGAETAVPG